MSPHDEPTMSGCTPGSMKVNGVCPCGQGASPWRGAPLEINELRTDFRECHGERQAVTVSVTVSDGERHGERR